LEARVETWEPPQRFRLPPVNFWPGTVTLRLEDALGGSTRVHVEHDGWPAKDDWYRAHADFWPRALDLLRAYLERPEAEFEAYRARKLGLTTA
jgi:peptidoglycan/xylan/chitin deacetylase (PgdA/CDA1 family)